VKLDFVCVALQTNAGRRHSEETYVMKLGAGRLTILVILVLTCGRFVAAQEGAKESDCL